MSTIIRVSGNNTVVRPRQPITVTRVDSTSIKVVRISATQNVGGAGTAVLYESGTALPSGTRTNVVIYSRTGQGNTWNDTYLYDLDKGQWFQIFLSPTPLP